VITIARICGILPAMWRLRPLAPAEHEWACESVAATSGWDEAVQRRLLAEALASRPRQVIECEGAPVGVLVTEDRLGCLYVSLIEPAPEWQGRGIGTAIPRDPARKPTLHLRG
jgi:hypothetical protein